MSFLENILNRDPREPAVEDVYNIEGVLGKGAFGIVYRAVNQTTGEAVACKTIHKSRLVHEHNVEDVQAEVQLLHHVDDHPNIVSILSTHEDKNTVHIVMTLCEGGELFDSIVEAGNYSEKKAAESFRTMADTVRHCHELGVMHRDLKPENFLLTTKDPKTQQLMLTDFGLGCFFKKEELMDDMVGSPFYIAPEVLLRNYSYKADMWSLGVILYIMLSGRPPFWGDTDKQIFEMILAGDIDFRQEPWPSLSENCKDCIRKLCKVDPNERSSAVDILRHPWLQSGNASDKPFEGEVIKRIKGFAAMNRMKKTAMLVIGQNLEPYEIAGMRHLFRTIDADQSGFISISELRQALSDWGHSIDPEELKRVMAIADVDGNGSIDYNEFVASTMQLSKLEKEALLQKSFAAFDENGDGHVTEDELKHVLEKFHLTDSASALLSTVDKNHDGMIDYNEFRTLMRTKKNGGDGLEDDVTKGSVLSSLRRMHV